jgi:RNA polymerase sigma-70 factor (ECF subfamily)
VTIYGDLVTEGTPISPATYLAAFARRFYEMRARMLRICTGLVGADHAEDVVQDTYLRTRDRLGQLHDPGRFEAWVARSAVNLCYNRHRSQRRLRERLPRLLAERKPSTDRDPGLRELIERLPPRERTVIVLHYGHGYRTDEVAALVGTSPTNARSILFRARRRLAVQLREAER